MEDITWKVDVSHDATLQPNDILLFGGSTVKYQRNGSIFDWASVLSSDPASFPMQVQPQGSNDVYTITYLTLGDVEWLLCSPVTDIAAAPSGSATASLLKLLAGIAVATLGAALVGTVTGAPLLSALLAGGTGALVFAGVAWVLHLAVDDLDADDPGSSWTAQGGRTGGSNSPDPEAQPA